MKSLAIQAAKGIAFALVAMYIAKKVPMIGSVVR